LGGVCGVRVVGAGGGGGGFEATLDEHLREWVCVHARICVCVLCMCVCVQHVCACKCVCKLVFVCKH